MSQEVLQSLLVFAERPLPRLGLLVPLGRVGEGDGLRFRLVLLQEELRERLLRRVLRPLGAEALLLLSVDLNGEAPRDYLHLVSRRTTPRPHSPSHSTATHDDLPITCEVAAARRCAAGGATPSRASLSVMSNQNRCMAL